VIAEVYCTLMATIKLYLALAYLMGSEKKVFGVAAVLQAVRGMNDNFRCDLPDLISVKLHAEGF